MFPDSPLMDVRVRKALNHAVNRDEINKAFFAGKGEIMYHTQLHPSRPGWNPDWQRNFQEEYGLDAALAFWLPSGRQRIRMNRATDTYSWVCAAPHSNDQLPIGRILWGGAEADARRILEPGNPNQDPDGPAWIGLHHPRLS